MERPNFIDTLTAFFDRYLSFPSPDFAFVASLWTIGTYLWPYFDAFPYFAITSATKRSGKTRFSELIGFACSNPRNFTAMTPAAVFRSLKDEHPTLIMDEAESLSSDAAGTMRSILNAGYRKGQSVPRIDTSSETGITEWPVYCPKLFVLIGDVNDTLRDRSIVLWMRRGDAPTRFIYRMAQEEGAAIGEALQEEIASGTHGAIVHAYESLALPFLTDREEEIWLPLFAICQVLAPGRIQELSRIAVDLASEKTRDAASFRDLAGAELEAENDEYARRLLRDLLQVMTGHRRMFTDDILDALKAIDVAPWRRFRGDGLTPMAMADLLARFPGLKPRLVKIRGKARRGYRREDVHKALQSL